jgi:hypothetical protein
MASSRHLGIFGKEKKHVSASFRSSIRGSWPFVAVTSGGRDLARVFGRNGLPMTCQKVYHRSRFLEVDKLLHTWRVRSRDCAFGGRGRRPGRDEGSNATDRTSIGRQISEIWPISLLGSLVKNRQIRHRTRFRADIDRFGSLNGRKRQNPLLSPTQNHQQEYQFIRDRLHLVWHRSEVKWPKYDRFPYYRSLGKIAKFDVEPDFEPISIDLDR